MFLGSILFAPSFTHSVVIPLPRKLYWIFAENAASVIQSRYRGYIARSKFLKTMEATCLLQKAIRAWLLAKLEAHKKENVFRTNAANKIQTAWKTFIAENVARVHHSAATIIQRYFRGWVLRRDYLILQRSAVKIQRARRHLKCKRLLQEAKALNSSAIIVQSYVRRWIAQKWTCKHKLCILQIQVILDLLSYLANQVNELFPHSEAAFLPFL